WSDGVTPADLCRRRVKLLGGRTNAHHRLSGTRQCQVIVGGETQPDQLDFGGRCFESWAALHRHAAAVYPVGLHEFRLLDQIVVLKPAAWGGRQFDRAQQSFRWVLLDRDQRPLVAELRFDAVARRAIEALERLDPAAEEAWGLLGQLVWQPGEL